MTGISSRAAFPAACMLLVLILCMAPAAADTMIREENTDHDGNDFDSLFPGTAGYDGTAESCRENCLARANCNGASYVTWDNSCWLKEVVPPASEREGVISFLRQKEGAGAAAASAPQATTAAPAGTPAPAATKKSPGFAGPAAVIGCIAVLVLYGKKD